MAVSGKAPVLVVVQLSGGNDFMNTSFRIPMVSTTTRGPRWGFRSTRFCPSTTRWRFIHARGAAEGTLRRRAGGYCPGHWLSQLQSFALPGHGYLAHLRAQ